MHAATSVFAMENQGPPSFSQKASYNQPFGSFDADALLNEALLDDSQEKIDHITANSSSVRMDLEPDPLSAPRRAQRTSLGMKEAFRGGSGKIQRNPLYEAQQALQQFNQVNSFGHQQSHSNASTEFDVNPGNPTSAFTPSQFSQTSSFSEPSLSDLRSQELSNHRINVAGYPNYEFPSNQLPNQVNSSNRTNTEQIGIPARFNVGSSLQGNLAPSSNVAPSHLTSTKQDFVASNTNVAMSPRDIDVNIQRLQAMEKLCESMKRSALTRDLVKQMSNRNTTTRDTPGVPLNRADSPRQPLSREGSSRGITRRSHHDSRHAGGGRGHTRGITVSGRGVGRQGSSRSEGSISPRNVFGNEYPATMAKTTFAQGMDTSSGHEHFKSVPASSSSSFRRQAPTYPERGLKRHRSNPTLTQRLNQIDAGSMDMTFDGISETDSV